MLGGQRDSQGAQAIRSATAGSCPPSHTLFCIPIFSEALDHLCVSLVLVPHHKSYLLGTQRVFFALSPFVPGVVKLCSLENSLLGLGCLAEG